jgi:hypothetical protein
VGDQNPLVSENPLQQPRVEVAYQMNDIDRERTISDGIGLQPMVGSMQQDKVKIEYIKG